MEKQNRQLDDFFREALQQHVVVPSDAAKAAFLKEASTLTRTVRPGRKVYYYLSGLLFLALICTGIFVGQPGFMLKKAHGEFTSANISSIPTNNTLLNNNPRGIKPATSTSLVTTLKHSNNSSRRSSQITRRLAQNNETGYMPSAEISGTSAKISENPTADIRQTQSTDEVMYAEMSPVTSIILNPVVPLVKPSEIISPIPQTKDEPKKEEEKSPEYEPKGHFDLGAYYAPEWMFNTLEGEKYANNFGVEGTFHFGNYSIRTGIGLSITKGTNELSINYNDFLGSFSQLDSVIFVWDASHTHLIPTYYFTTTSVWDSLMKTQQARLIKRYTYLQVPLILGYDFLRTQHFSIGLRAGPVISFLLKTEQISDNYDPGKDHIIQINQITPDRIQTNWQFIGGINAGFGITRRLWLEIEPDVRYYFNSVYEKPANNTKPWSAGFRVALLFRK